MIYLLLSILTIAAGKITSYFKPRKLQIAEKYVCSMLFTIKIIKNVYP